MSAQTKTPVGDLAKNGVRLIGTGRNALLSPPPALEPSIGRASRRTALRLYSAMLLIRRTEEALMAEYHPADEMRCPIHFCVGQEGPPAGLCGSLRPDDYLFSHHRSHGYYLAKGGSLRGMFAEFYGKSTGSNGGKAGHQEISDHDANFYSGTILVGHLPIAAGVAWTFKKRQEDRVVAAVFGDGGADEGTTYEALNFAALKRLPLVFICENNSYSTYSAQWARQPSCNLAERASAFGIPARRIYGNDVMAVYRAARQAVIKARSGGGPTFLELITYRWCGHVGPENDDHLGYRPASELRAWQERCPIESLEAALHERGWLDATKRELYESNIATEIREAFAFAKSSPFPRPEELLKDNFAGPNKDTSRLHYQLPRQLFDYHQSEARLRPY